MSTLLRETLWAVLFPLACLWAVVTKARRTLASRRTPYQPSRPTVIVGNLHSGGSGKTPILAAIAERFADKHPVAVSRGYGGALTQTGARVNADNPRGWQDYGDEPWMLGQRLGIPVFIGADRVKSFQKAEAETQAGFFLLDDAFQNFTFRQDTRLVAIRADRPVEDAYCLPLGDLREPLGALRAASAVVLVRGKHAARLEAWKTTLARLAPGVPVFEADVQVQGVWGAEGKVTLGSSLLWAAFCGIGYPESFRESLKGWVEPKFVETFADHHAYTDEDVEGLLKQKRAAGANFLLTTEKDWHKVAPLFAAKDEAVFYLRIGYVFSEEFWYFLQTRLESA